MSETAAPVFEYVETFEIKGRGTAYAGPAPFDLGADAYGRKVLVDGVERAISGFEQRNRPPRKGEPTSLLFHPLTPKDTETPT